MQRPNVFSYGDLAVLRGMRMVYHHRKIDRKLFEKYRRRLSPYCSVASLYFWAVAGGAIPDMKDYAPKKESRKNERTREIAKQFKTGIVRMTVSLFWCENNKNHMPTGLPCKITA